MNKVKKIQNLLITHLLEKGQIELTLPDGMVVKLGITQQNERGEQEKTKDYCFLVASQKDRTISMDSYNLDLRYIEESGKIIIEDDMVDENGRKLKVFSAI